MTEEYKLWIKQAESDLDSAEILFKNKKFEGASFYAQQTSEKALKGVVIKVKKKLMKIHDLVVLGMQAGVKEELINKCQILTQVYSASRYGIIESKIPSEIFSEEKTKSHIKIAKEVLEWSKKQI